MTDFQHSRQFFSIPDGEIYLDGNSLGPLPVTAAAAVQKTIQKEWGQMLIKAWNDAGWMDQPDQIGDRIAPIVGAQSGTITTGDTLSIKVFQALSAAIALRPQRRIILSDNGNFPSDLYMASGLVKLLDKGYELRVVAPEEVPAALTEDVAVLMLTHVDYRTGRMHDMRALTAQAQKMGVITVWDLAHSAGAVPTQLHANQVDFAIGCTYKFLNGGPGAPAFIYVRPELLPEVSSALSGWLGHRAPFAFDQHFSAAEGIAKFRVGTPSVLSMASLEAALAIWNEISIDAVREKSIELSELMIAEVTRRCPLLTLASPKDPTQRGSQVSFHCEFGYALVQALIAQGVTGDFRAPDIVRFGITPLYINEADILQAVDKIQAILDSGSWDQAEFHTRKAVT